MAELGEIKKPSINQYIERRKVYCVNNILIGRDTPDDLKGIVQKYWHQVEEQLERLELAGRVKKVFCEAIYTGGEEALRTLSEINEYAGRIVKKKLEEGAELLPLEDPSIYGPYLDWRNCLVVVQTEEVYRKVAEFFQQYHKLRLQHIQKRLQDSIGPAEAALLIMADEERAKIQFPPDMEVFLVTPPAHDEILKWFRDNLRNKTEGS